MVGPINFQQLTNFQLRISQGEEACWVIDEVNIREQTFCLLTLSWLNYKRRHMFNYEVQVIDLIFILNSHNSQIVILSLQPREQD